MRVRHRAVSTRPISSNRRSHAASCRPSAPRRSTSTARTSRRTRPSSAASRRWSIEPTTCEETLQILRNIASRYEQHHKVRYTEEALEACVELTNRYITDRFFPDKAIDVLDEAGSRMHLQTAREPDTLREMEAALASTCEERREAVRQLVYEKRRPQHVCGSWRCVRNWTRAAPSGSGRSKAIRRRSAPNTSRRSSLRRRASRSNGSRRASWDACADSKTTSPAVSSDRMPPWRRWRSRSSARAPDSKTRTARSASSSSSARRASARRCWPRSCRNGSSTSAAG